ncbi:hypothetical protein [Streptomyces sp. NPDC002540]
MELFDTVIDSHARIGGLDGRGPLDRPEPGRYHVNEVGFVPSRVDARAWHGCNGFPRVHGGWAPWPGPAPGAGASPASWVISTSKPPTGPLS